MTTTSFSRRRLLASIAAAGGASRLGPFLPNALHAATAPKRILTVFHPMGYVESSFWPTLGTNGDFTLGATQTALNPWKNKLIYMDGIGIYGTQYWFKGDDNEHGNGGNMVFTGCKKVGYANGPSVEQAVADYQYSQAKTQYRALALGVNGGGSTYNHFGVFYSKAQTPVIAQTSPQAAFDTLFKDFKGPSLPPGMQAPGGAAPIPIDTSAVDRARKQKLAVLNGVKEDLGRIKKLAGKDDLEKVDAHLDGISSLENRLKLMSRSDMPLPSEAPGAPAVPPGSAGIGCAKPASVANGKIEDRVHSQMDIITAAFACDLTRSASLTLGNCDGGMDEAVPGLNLHSIAHAVSGKPPDPAVLENHRKFDRWFAARWAYLLGRLDSIKEGNGTLLDNTLIIFGSDTTTFDSPNWDSGPHNAVRFPLWMAGGGAFAFKTGQSIKVASPKTTPRSAADCAKWTTQNQVFTSVCQAFGMGVTKFGDNDQGKGGVPELIRV